MRWLNKELGACLVRESILLWEYPFSCESIHSLVRESIPGTWVKVKLFYAFIVQMRKLRQPFLLSFSLLNGELPWGCDFRDTKTPGNPRYLLADLKLSLTPQTLLLPTPEVSEWGSWNKLGLHLQHAMSKGKHRIPSKGLEGTFIQMTIFQSRVRSPPRVHNWIPGFSVIITINLSVSILSLKTQQSKLSVKGLPWWSSG